MSGKQRRAEIMRKRLERAKRIEEALRRPTHGRHLPSDGVVQADQAVLARHNNTYSPLPSFYADRVFVCRDCGEEQVWTARQQKWWYEIAAGAIDSHAVRCLPCRRARKASHRHPGSDRIGERCARLRALGARAPDADAWGEIEAALTDKWWGVRTVAIATLGAWGDARAVARLQALVTGHAGGRGWSGWGYEARRAAFKALGECLPVSEAEWALAYYLDNADAAPLRRPLTRMPVGFWEAVVASEWRADIPSRLQHLCRLLPEVAASASQQRLWRERFASHPNEAIRRWAAWAWRDSG